MKKSKTFKELFDEAYQEFLKEKLCIEFKLKYHVEEGEVVLDEEIW